MRVPWCFTYYGFSPIQLQRYRTQIAPINICVKNRFTHPKSHTHPPFFHILVLVVSRSDSDFFSGEANRFPVGWSSQDIHLAGLSGGAWTASIVAAMDQRLRTSIQVAGASPRTCHLGWRLFWGVFINGGTPKSWMAYWKIPNLKWMIWGYPHGNLHIN